MLSFIENVIAGKGLYHELLNPVCKKYNLTESEILILLHLGKMPKDNTATDIVEKQRLKKSVVSVSIKDLQKMGLITSAYTDDNHRSIHLKLTDEAKKIVKEAKKIEDKYFEIVTKGFDNQDKQMFNDYLKRISDNIKSYRKKWIERFI